MADAPKPAPKPEAKYEPPKELEQKAAVQKFQGRPKRQPVEQAEYFYNVKGTHIAFFLASAGMLISFLMMFAKDDLRPWKPYQREFANMDFEKLWFDMNDLQEKVTAREKEIGRINTQIESILSRFPKAAPEDNQGKEFDVDEFKAQGLLPVPGLEKAPFNGKVKVFVNKKNRLEFAEKELIRGDLYRKLQLMNFAKDELGAVRFRYEESKHHFEDAVKNASDRRGFYEAHYQKEKKAWERVNKDVEDAKAEADAVQKQSDFCDDFAGALEKRTEGKTWKVAKSLEALQAEKAEELKKLEAAKGRFEKEKPSFANTVRNAPGSDFFAPTLKVRNHILPDIKDQLNFAAVTKVDRCDTCHVGIDNPNYEVRINSDLEEGDEKKYTFKNEFLQKFVAHARGQVDKKDCVVCDEKGRSGKEIKAPLTKHGAWETGADAVKFTKVFMAHPRLDLFVSDSSKHGISKMGCTICHEGDGRDTDFTRVVHTPNTAKQGKEWRARHGTPYGEERYNWNYRELWDLPMFPTKYVQASCRRCHTDAVELDGGEKYVQGMKLVERVGCFGCHRMDTYQILPKDVNNVAVDANRKNRRPGPPLTRIATKVTEDWAAKWVLAPRDFRPTTRMPHFFQQSNTRTVVNKNPYPVAEVNGVKRSPVDDTIVQSLVKYIWSLSDTQPDPAPPALKGDPIKGEIVIKSVGCTACHKIEETPLAVYQDAGDKLSKRSRFLEEFAPSLHGVGSKMNKAWLYAWVKNPKMHFKESSMPNLRLSEQEATDVVEYLMTLKKPEWEKLAAPQANPKIVDDLILELLKKVMSDHDAAEAVAGKNPRDEYKEMATPEGKVRWLGRKMTKNFGCYSCHKLKDDSFFKWQDEEGIGVELTGSQPWGSKHHDKLDFGFTADDHVNHHGVAFKHGFTGDEVKANVHEHRSSWLEAKLADPRVFDGGKMSSKPWDELLRMPNFGLNKKEIELIATFIQSFTDHNVTGLVDGAKMRPTGDQLAMYRGDRIARENNCKACHRMSLDKFVISWARKEGGKFKETEVVVEGRFGREEPADSIEGNLRRWKDPETRKPLLGEKEDLKASGKKLFTYSWTSDHRTLGHPGITPETKLDAGESRVINPDSKYIYFDGHDRWYLDVQGGEIKHKRPVVRYHPQDGGDIIPELRKFKRDLSEANKPYDGKAWEPHVDFMDISNESEFESRWAPMLRTQGVKTQTDWLFKFLKAPYPIRPTLQPIYPGAKALPDVNLRMPTFEFSDEESNSLVKWFAVRDQLPGVDSFPSTEFPERSEEFLKARKGALEKADKIVKDTNTGCASCHYMAGSAPPGVVLKHAPDLARVEERLRPRWMYQWQGDPSAIYPGTTMTQYDFKPIFGGNQQDGVNAAVEHLLNFGKFTKSTSNK